MSSSKHISRAMHPISKVMLLALLVPAALLIVPVARAFNSGDIIVESARGDARLTQGGRERDLRRGQIIVVPATVRTGHDGVVDLRQGATTVNIGPDSVLDFPASQERGVPVERIVQSKGNAFYDVGKRDGRKLRVETPYLVAVIKGTQFSVSVQENSTSISLVEGSLEILSTDGGATVDLQAGEIASRSRGDGAITVVDIEAPRIRVPAPTVVGATAMVDVNAGRTGVEAGVAPTLTTTSADLDATLSVTAGQVAAVDTAASLDLGTGGVAADAGIGVAADTDLSLGAGPVDAGLTTTTDIDVGSSGAGVAIGADATVDTGLVGAELDAGVSTDVDLASGSVDLGLDLGGVDVDLGVDLGLDEATTEEVLVDDTSTDTQVGIVEEVGGVLGGLLRFPGTP